MNILTRIKSIESFYEGLRNPSMKGNDLIIETGIKNAIEFAMVSTTEEFVEFLGYLEELNKPAKKEPEVSLKEVKLLVIATENKNETDEETILKFARKIINNKIAGKTSAFEISEENSTEEEKEDDLLMESIRNLFEIKEHKKEVEYATSSSVVFVELTSSED